MTVLTNIEVMPMGDGHVVRLIAEKSGKKLRIDIPIPFGMISDKYQVLAKFRDLYAMHNASVSIPRSTSGAGEAQGGNAGANGVVVRRAGRGKGGV